MKKKIISCILACTMGLGLLVGCGSSDNGGATAADTATQDSSSAETDTAAETAEADTAGGQDKVVIHYYSWSEGVGSVVLQGAVNGLGSDIVAAQTAGGKAAQFLAVPLESIGTAMTTYASQNMGAHDLNRVNRGVNTALGIGVVYSIASFLILRVADKPLIGLFLESDQTEIMANAQSFIFWNSVFYIPLAVLIIYRYTIQGLGYSSLAMFAGVAEMVARALVGFLFVPLWGYFAACIASPVAWFFACFFLIPAYIVVYRRLKKEKLVPHANL